MEQKRCYISFQPDNAEGYSAEDKEAEKFRLPRFAVQKSGNIIFAHGIQPRDKAYLCLTKKDWNKMLDILIHEKPVYWYRELLHCNEIEDKDNSIRRNDRKRCEGLSFHRQQTILLSGEDRQT